MARRKQADFIYLYELLLVLLVVAAAFGTLFPTMNVWVFKARFVSVLLNLRPQQIESVEHFALTGSWLESGAEIKHTEPGAERQASDLEKELRATPRARSLAPKSGEGRLIGGADNVALGRGASSRYGIVDGSIVVVGRIQGYPRPFQLTIRPAVRDSDEPATIIWLCGERSTPPNWLASGPQLPASLPPAYLYAQCRKDRTS